MSTPYVDRELPSPEYGPETAAFWEATAQGRFMLRGCGACGKKHWYPRAICPFCFSEDTEWEEASGDGTIYSYTVMRRAKVPYALAYVTLAEGPTMMTNIVDSDFDTMEIGAPVNLVFKPTGNGAQLPMFKLAGAAGA